MRKAIGLVLVAMFICSVAYAGQVRGYTRSDGTYVNSYQRSDPNPTVTDNYGYKGNVNPYTGAVGTNYNRNSPSSAYYGTSSTRSSSSKSWDGN